MKCGSKFVLRLWSGIDNGTIVECQRESGCGFVFCDICKIVLKAAKTGIIKKKKTVPNLAKPPTEQTPSSTPDLITPVDPKLLIEDSLSIARDRIQSDRVDYQLLGIESLSQISSSPVCRCAARKIISCESNGDIMKVILSLIMFSRLDGHPPVTKKNHGEIDSIEDEYYNAMHRRALTVLANCLSTLNEFGELKSTLSTNTSIVSDDLLIALVNIVAKSASIPHEAAEAYKCLDLVSLQSEYAEKRIGQLVGSMYVDRPPTFY